MTTSDRKRSEVPWLLEEPSKARHPQKPTGEEELAPISPLDIKRDLVSGYDGFRPDYLWRITNNVLLVGKHSSRHSRAHGFVLHTVSSAASNPHGDRIRSPVNICFQNFCFRDWKQQSTIGDNELGD